MLYFRTLLVMCISLYTSRIALNILGVSDYGIYGVVGGLVTLFSFFNISMLTATQRFLAFELGNNRLKQYRIYFSSTILILLVVSLIVLFLSETVGLWFLKYKMVIPIERFGAAKFIYQFTIISFIINIIQIPYNASIVVHEKMNIYAYISICDVVLKLFTLYLIAYLPFDKLELYSVFMFLITVFTFLFYFIYCNKVYPECRFTFFFEKKAIKKLISYTGWNMFGGMASVVFHQITNIMLNVFFGTVINAARGLSIQVNSALTSVASNIRIASTPQIIKSYSSGDEKYMMKLLFQSTKYSIGLILLFSIPLFLEAEYVIHKWLKIIPDYTIIFCQLFVIYNIVESLSAPLVSGIQANGNISKYQIISSLILFLNLPISYLFLKFGFTPEITIYVNILIAIFILIIRMFFLDKLTTFSSAQYVKVVLFPSAFIIFISFLIPTIIHTYYGFGFKRFVFVVISSTISVLSVFYMLLSKREKINLRKILKQKLNW